MKKKSNSMIYLAIALILIVITASLIINALARYANQYTGHATVNAAAWSFKEGNLTQTVALTATADNLAEGKIAPGTSGSFTIDLDGSGSGTGVKYTITLAKPEGTPEGLVLKVNGSEVESITGYIAYATGADAMKKTVTVNWEWSIGEDATETTGVDNKYQGQSYTVDVTVRGEQWTDAIPSGN